MQNMVMRSTQCLPVVGGQRELREFDAPVQRHADDIAGHGIEQQDSDHQGDQRHGGNADLLRDRVNPLDVGPDHAAPLLPER